MALIVQKYGGTSVGTVERIMAVARKIADARSRGDGIVVVVSAMGHTTDELLRQAGEISSSPPSREVDRLLATGEEQAMALVAMALHEVGVPAISLTGPQAGIRTSGPYGKAIISRIRPARAIKALESGQVVIVAGFQGSNRSDDVTTLGRGGSDTTAVALAAALKADRCEIYTDVEGIFTADPRIVPEARKIDVISYDEMAELAWRGAKMHPRSIELAKLYGVPVIVASSFVDKPGTLITDVESVEAWNKAAQPAEGQAMENVKTISGIAYEMDVAKITISRVPTGPETLAAIFGPLADRGISVDVIVFEANGKDDAPDGRRRANLSFTIAESELAAVTPIVREAAEALGAADVSTAGGFAKVSIVGTGMLNRPGYAARMFRGLSSAKIEVEMVTTSEIQMTCVIARDNVAKAVRRLHGLFGLDRSAVLPLVPSVTT